MIPEIQTKLREHIGHHIFFRNEQDKPDEGVIDRVSRHAGKIFMKVYGKYGNLRDVDHKCFEVCLTCAERLH